ncbi:helix-turn-helix domain-containing protein [Streptomyces sp. PSKA54]|uniref:Helix-turn-helix domain-containing protein n=1 Tax=Streptomyces himalayensis subsp. aureolus TaxID=2758039 RepID=A0A7W2D9I9_9ACTN|nr:helix-turn-helix domain-containing protein [Streptomyces himalayensis]MBA4867083.1 helix-turn-helix domain-containing protein [Streptomyces himalayensis subsp. aureolus]
MQQSDDVRRRNLSRLLIKQRSLLTPQDVGLPQQATRHRRGLEQEQVAFLSGTTLRWYSALENGELSEVDPGLLSDVATALRLSPEERTDLFCLAARVVPPSLSHRRPVPDACHLAALEAAEPNPAVLTDHAWNVLAANEAVADWFQDPGTIEPDDRNALLWLFTGTAAARIADIADARRLAIARLQIVYTMCRGEAALDALVSRVVRHPVAERLWRDERASLGPGFSLRRVRHPEHGESPVLITSTDLPGGLRLIVCLPRRQPRPATPAATVPAPLDAGI